MIDPWGGSWGASWGISFGSDALVIAPEASPIVTGGVGYPRLFRIPVDLLQAQRVDEDELIALVIAQALPLLH